MKVLQALVERCNHAAAFAELYSTAHFLLLLHPLATDQLADLVIALI